MNFFTVQRSCSAIIAPVISAFVFLACISSSVLAQNMSDYSAKPPISESSTPPLVMLLMSRDNQLWHKAYNDYSDLDGDGVLDTTYKDSFEYYGYFNSSFCYRYQGGSDDGQFQPAARVADGSHRCDQHSGPSDARWSGNFLNWLTMTRIDIVRKVLYGGSRVVGSNNLEADYVADRGTLLQRAMIPSDNHAFVKIVRLADLPVGQNISYFTPFRSTVEAISFCNVTDYVSGSNDRSGAIDVRSNPPKLKVAFGDFPTWAASESAQCLYADEHVRGTGERELFAPARPTAAEIGTALVDGVSFPAALDARSVAELVVKVSVCRAGQDQSDTRSCRAYPRAVKPFGLLQTYGESGEVQFGLMTGSYERSRSGGVLRKNISSLNGENGVRVEINPNTGAFDTIDEDDDAGIIQTLEALRVSGWFFNQRRYGDCSTPGISESNLSDSVAERRCRDWGNPMTEMYVEALRYFRNSGASGSRLLGPTFSVDDSGRVEGLNTETTWRPPYRSETACSRCSIVILSTGLNTFDSNEADLLAATTGLGEAFSSDAISASTNAIGEAEGLYNSANRYVVGNSGADQNDRCTAKSIGDLSSVHGVCPEVPTLNGSYKIAGAAHIAHTQDLYDDGVAEQRRQSLKTYAVSLAESLPTFEIALGDTGSVSFVPTCHSSNAEVLPSPSDQSWSPCTLVDLTVLEQRPNYGRFLIAWEDSLWGNDYDQDALVELEYCTYYSGAGGVVSLDEACPSSSIVANNDYNRWIRDDNRAVASYWSIDGNYFRRFEERPLWRRNEAPQLQLRASVRAASAGFSMRFGYIINGSTADDSYDSQLLRPGNYNFNSIPIAGAGGPDQRQMVIWDLGNTGVNSANASVKYAANFSSASNAPKFLENPLWYAVKYGNFDESHLPPERRTGLPDDVSKWDRLNLHGTTGADRDGYPDGYFPVKNPARLAEAMDQIFRGISARVSSGTSASVNAQTSTGEGAVYQAYYNVSVESESSSGTPVNWVGALNAFFIDRFGNIRDDSGTVPGQIDDADRILVSLYDDEREQTFIYRYEIQADGSRGAPVGNRITYDDASFQPIWSAVQGLRQQLSSSGNISQNRASISSSAANGRYIFTAFDRDGNGIVVNSQSGSANLSPEATHNGALDGSDIAVEFVASNFAASNDGDFFLDLPGLGDLSAASLVNYVRGEEIAGLRSRRVNGLHYPLGDIIHSSPALVGRPKERYDLLYGDQSYREFFNVYRNRRNVAYVGANDGMLHAFNAGFFDAENSRFQTTRGAEGTPHPLGAELWAYIPFNVLPHLKWLASPDYSHVYYVDGPVQAFEVNIFPASERHPGGWGTIIVVGMRFGGGDYNLEEDDTQRTTRSAYIIMDVTDPETPQLVAEVTDPDLGFSTSKPSIVKRRELGEDGVVTRNDWFLVFGSGPRGDGSTASMRSALQQGVSRMPATLFSFDLVNKTLSKTSDIGGAGVNDSEPASFLANFTSVDWNLDFVDDAVYFGLVSGEPLAPGGKLKRGVVRNEAGSLFSDVNDLFNDVSLPFSASPLALRDHRNDFWVYAGTGRYIANDDNTSSAQQSFFAIKEPKDEQGNVTYSAEVGLSRLFDTSQVEVYTDGRVRAGGSAVSLSGACSGNDLEVATADRFDVLADYIEDGCAGWRFDFYPPGIRPGSLEYEGSGGGIRNITKAAAAGRSVVIAAFDPDVEQCDVSGVTYLYARDRRVGLPPPDAPLGTDSRVRLPSDVDGRPDAELVLSGVEAGDGVPPDVLDVIPRPASGGGGSDPCYGVLLQGSRVENRSIDVDCPSIPAGRRGWAEIPVIW